MNPRVLLLSCVLIKSREQEGEERGPVGSHSPTAQMEIPTLRLFPHLWHSC